MKKRAAAVGEAAPRVLFIDIETFPLTIFSWGVYEQNALAVKEHSVICCYSAKWLNGRHITKALPDYKGYRAGKHNDKRLVAELWALLDAADVVVAQNGDAFDIKKINTRFVRYGLKPPSPYKTVDTLKVARRVFRFDSNKLDDLCAYLKIGRKLSTGGFGLWLGCMAGQRKAWARMKRYNAHDTRLLAALYARLLPWILTTPRCTTKALRQALTHA